VPNILSSDDIFLYLTIMLETLQISSPLGFLKLTISPIGLKSIELIGEKNTEFNSVCSERALPYKIQLDEYFEGNRERFTINLDLMDLPPFQREVLKMVSTIPFGKTRTYKQIAAVLGSEKKARAVGRANSLNPIPIVIPCHRVIGNDGELTGYTFGLSAKMKLLTLESLDKYVPQIDLFDTSI